MEESGLLLDTHIWLWSLLDPERLSEPVRDSLTGGRYQLWISPISPWEASLLIEKGRLQVDGSSPSWIRSALRAAPLREAPLTTEIALLSREIALPHPDPADRFLCATAQAYGLTMVTADARIIALPGLSVLPNA